MTHTFSVPGVPVPQGSMRAVRHGARIAVVSDNPSLRTWRKAVSAAAAAAVHEEIGYAVSVKLDFRLPRPKSRRKDPYPATRPDLDKLVRAVLDGITDAGAWKDDGLVVGVSAEKRWADDDPGCDITIAAAPR